MAIRSQVPLSPGWLGDRVADWVDPKFPTILEFLLLFLKNINPSQGSGWS